jgi:hypothetical protein
MHPTKKIYIDFQGGSHGNYLEFVCNQFLANVPAATALPFNDLNAAHKKRYLSEPLFECGHYTTYDQPLTNETVISISIVPDDLLALQCVSLLRAGDYKIEPDKLEVDTYHKLSNRDYQCVLDNLQQSFFNEQHAVAAYHAIADAQWPKISSLEDYHGLPEHIRQECEHVHGFTVQTLDEQHPDCARSILLEFFQAGFAHPEMHGFMTTQQKQTHRHCRIYHFPYACFYDLDGFRDCMKDLSGFLDLPFDGHDPRFINLHQEFLTRQPYRDVKQRCDQLVDRISQDPDQGLPQLDVIQEAYVRTMLSKKYSLYV